MMMKVVVVVMIMIMMVVVVMMMMMICQLALWRYASMLSITHHNLHPKNPGFWTQLSIIRNPRTRCGECRIFIIIYNSRSRKLEI